jgi:hypothetical protein
MAKMDLIDSIEQEGTDLQLHVDLCAQRYSQLINKLDVVDDRLNKIDTALLEIKEVLTKDETNQYKRYLGWSGVLVVTLLGAVIHLVTK